MVVGSQIGSYRIERILGEGGMGVVYVGVDLRLGRRAAIKQLLPELSGQRDVVERFFNEAKAAAKINHPGIVEIYEVGWHTDGSAYFAMKLLDGDSLAKRLRQGPMQLATACTVARQIASALAAAHAAGIVHRDLKPDNIILVRDDEVALGERAIVLDFGIAKLTGDWQMSHKTRTHTIMGTPWYMSPEQCRGAGEVDHRSDVYAVGCLLFEMLTGRPPFVADGGGEVLGMHQFVQPPVVSSLRDEVPIELEAIVMRCLAKQPDQRHQTMAELVMALQACLPRPSAQDSVTSAPLAVRAGRGAPQPPGPVTVLPLPSTLTGGRGEIATRHRTIRKRGLVLGVVVAAAVVSAVAVLVVVSTSGNSDSGRLGAAPGSAVAVPDAAGAVATPNTGSTTPTPTAPLPAATTPTATAPSASAMDPTQGAKVASPKESLPRQATPPAPSKASTEPSPPKETTAPKSRKGASKPAAPGGTDSASKVAKTDQPDGLDHTIIADGVAKVKAQGVLELSSKPPCDIAIDGSTTGLHTPQKEIKLPVGRHRITLTNAEFSLNETFTVDIKADAREKLIKDYSDRLPN